MRDPNPNFAVINLEDIKIGDIFEWYFSLQFRSFFENNAVLETLCRFVEVRMDEMYVRSAYEEDFFDAMSKTEALDYIEPIYAARVNSKANVGIFKEEGITDQLINDIMIKHKDIDEKFKNAISLIYDEIK
uniref:Uncharacterized protein n=1 Tax=Acrobeloides nanus TaxID=290746 RepID=A0A914CRE6_9BILA